MLDVSKRRLNIKTRESGMPDLELWESFFNPAIILQKMGLNRNCRNVVDLGCGYGTFSIAAAQITKGTIHAIDIDEGFIAVCKLKAIEAGLNNIKCEQRDFTLNGIGLDDSS